MAESCGTGCVDVPRVPRVGFGLNMGRDTCQMNDNIPGSADGVPDR